jgi:SAM-dependent methyltransferase
MKNLAIKLIPAFLKRKYIDYKKYNALKEYEGDSVYCPICHSSYREFGPFGLIKRNNAKCHNCGSLERHRLIWKYLNDELQVMNKPLTILHFAPEKMFYNILSGVAHFDYHPCDLFPELYNYSGPTKILKADITEIPFNADYFDLIICSHVLEHIPDDKKAMSELFRVMKPGGFGIFQVPIDYDSATTYEDFSITTPEVREKAFGQYDHVRLYGRDYKNRLESVGFQVIEDDYVNTFSDEEKFRYGFIKSELIYNCKKTVANEIQTTLTLN